MPSLQDIQDAIDSAENYLAQQLPVIGQSLQRLIDDLSRFGPPAMPELPTINLPAVGPFASIPPPPPPPPPPPTETYTEQVSTWVSKHKLVAVGIGSAVGIGIVAGGLMYRNSPYFKARNAKTKTSDRKDVIILLGADTKLGPSLVEELRNRGFVIIASVSSPDDVASVEKKGKGFVKALVLDPHDPTSITPFLRSLQSSLSLRFPFTPGDPYTSTPSQLPNVVSLVSLLSLLPVEIAQDSSHWQFPSNTPSLSASIESLSPLNPQDSLSTLSISKLYLPHLVATHLTPLSVIQSVLSLFRSSRKRGSKQLSLVVALQGGPESAGLGGYDASSAMSNAAMAKGCEILRREIKLSPELKGTRVVVIDVGEISVSDQSSGHSFSSRTPTPVKHFTRAVGRVVGYAKSHESVVSCHHGSSYTGAVGYAVCGLTLTIRDWWRGDRFSIGAGASSYSLASRLPIRFLDILLLLPRRILSYRDWLRREAIHADRQAREMARERRREKERADQKQAESPLPPVPQQRPSGPPKLIQHHEEVPVPPASSSKAPSTASGALSDIDSLPSDVDHDSLSNDGHSEAESESGKSDRLSASWVSLKEGSDENERMDGSTTTIGESATHQEANVPVA